MLTTEQICQLMDMTLDACPEQRYLINQLINDAVKAKFPIKTEMMLDQIEHVRSVYREKGKIPAIKLCRTYTGACLRDAKFDVETRCTDIKRPDQASDKYGLLDLSELER